MEPTQSRKLCLELRAHGFWVDAYWGGSKLDGYKETYFTEFGPWTAEWSCHNGSDSTVRLKRKGVGGAICKQEHAVDFLLAHRAKCAA